MITLKTLIILVKWFTAVMSKWSDADLEKADTQSDKTNRKRIQS